MKIIIINFARIIDFINEFAKSRGGIEEEVHPKNVNIVIIIEKEIKKAKKNGHRETADKLTGIMEEIKSSNSNSLGDKIYREEIIQLLFKIKSDRKIKPG